MLRADAEAGLLVRLRRGEHGVFGIIKEVGPNHLVVEWENGQTGVLYWEPAHVANAFRLEVAA